MKGLSFEQHLRERIRQFDMPALLGLLAKEGYGEGEIEYRSHRTLVHQSHLVHDIQFIHVPRRRVILIVNIGLLSAQSPLPTFLLQMMDQMDPPWTERMERFLGYFDHELLQARFAGLSPERSHTLLPDWEEAAPNRLSMLSLTSPSMLHWLFSRTFPEAEVSVRRDVYAHSVATHCTQMSATALGDSASLEGFASIPRGNLAVTLFFNERHCGTGAPWELEAPHRLTQRILPLLVQTSLHLTVQMVLRVPSIPAILQQDSYLGHVTLKNAKNITSLPLFCGMPSH